MPKKKAAWPEGKETSLWVMSRLTLLLINGLGRAQNQRITSTTINLEKTAEIIVKTTISMYFRNFTNKNTNKKATTIY